MSQTTDKEVWYNDFLWFFHKVCAWKIENVPQSYVPPENPLFSRHIMKNIRRRISYRAKQFIFLFIIASLSTLIIPCLFLFFKTSLILYSLLGTEQNFFYTRTKIRLMWIRSKDQRQINIRGVSNKQKKESIVSRVSSQTRKVHDNHHDSTISIEGNWLRRRYFSLA